MTDTPFGATIRVLGIGGGGSNTVDRMIQFGLSGVDFIAANTDAQALHGCSASVKLQLGARSTRGLGAGGAPEVGERAALESRDEITEALAGSDMVFLTAGMGGGTGTGAIPVAAEVAHSLGAVTIAVVTTPFGFEGRRRAAAGQLGIEKLRRHVDTLIVVPNDRLLHILPKDAPFEVAFHVADDVLRQGVQGIAELVTRTGMINVDFAHVRTLMRMAGGAYLAIGHGQGPNKALDAAQQALHHPLLDLNAVDHAAGVLVHVAGGEDLALHEVRQAIVAITEAASPEAEIIFGASVDPILNGQAQVILIATGVGGQSLDAIYPAGRLTVGSIASPTSSTANRVAGAARTTLPASRLSSKMLQSSAAKSRSTSEWPGDTPDDPRTGEVCIEKHDSAFMRRRRSLLYQRNG